MSRITITQTGGTLSVDETQVAVVVIVGEQGPAGVGAESALLIANNLSEMNTPEKKAAARANLAIPAPETLAQQRWVCADFIQGGGNEIPYAGTAIASGLSGANVAALEIPEIFGARRIVSSTTTNSGFRFQMATGIRTTAGLFSRAIMAPLNAHTGTTVRLGFHDATVSNDAVDGVYFEIAEGVAVLKAANNSTRTTSAESLALSLSTFYIFDIEFTSTTEAVGRIIDLVTGVVLQTFSVASNIPTSNTRLFFHGLVAPNVGVVAVDLCSVDYLGFGPARPAWIAAF